MLWCYGQVLLGISQRHANPFITCLNEKAMNRAQLWFSGYMERSKITKWHMH